MHMAGHSELSACPEPLETQRCQEILGKIDEPCGRSKYVPVAVWGFDLFPHTPFVEVAVLFRRIAGSLVGDDV